MVYKKWIKKDGKLYGPYIYESKRIDGKVVSEYHGPKKTFNLKKYSWIFISAAVFIILIYFFSTFDFGSMTGKAVLNTKIDYVQNEPVRGNLLISLNQGELLPTNSKIILENSGQTYEYDLNKFVSEKSSEGNFYINGVPLSGSGEGYGIEGEKIVYPEVSFILNIYPAENEVPVPVVESPVNETTEIPVVESPVNETTEIPVVENPVEVETETTPVENPAENEVISEIAETSSETSISEETSPITGFFVRIYNFFLGLTLTGKAISEAEIIEVSGKTSLNNPFVYDIPEGAGVQLKPGSISVPSGVISEDNVNLKVEGNLAIVETSYSEKQKGFGQEFLGEKTKLLNVDLSELGLILNDGELKVKVIFENNEIFSTSLMLVPGETTSILENVSNFTTLNITIEQPLNNTLNETNETVSVIFGEKIPHVINFETVQFVLTEEDKSLLSEVYGDIVVSTSKSEVINNKLVKRYEIGKDWIEYSYDPNIPENEIDIQASIDRMKWLKDLAERIKIKKENEQKQSPQIVETFSVE